MKEHSYNDVFWLKLTGEIVNGLKIVLISYRGITHKIKQLTSLLPQAGWHSLFFKAFGLEVKF